MKRAVFSESFRRHAVQKMFSRGQQSLNDLARELGCSTPSLYKWAKIMKLSPVTKHISKWTPLERCGLIVEFSQISEADRGVWLRSKDLPLNSSRLGQRPFPHLLLKNPMKWV